MARESEDAPLQPFPATRWSLVERARQPDEQGRHEALAYLLKRYLPALRSHLLYEKRLAADRTEDLLQGFVADKIIEQNLLEHARQRKGKFRSFLLATLNNYLISLYRCESAAKRSPAERWEELDGKAADLKGGQDPAEQFNTEWARELIAEAIRRMEAECANAKRLDLWTIFQGRVLRPAFEGQEAAEYSDLVKQLNLTAPLEACHLLATAKRMFMRNLRAVASEYAGANGDTEAEIDDLRKTLAEIGAQNGRLPRK
jgi:RNA polymerase sigma-70 factor (ECF subfamily)